MNYLNILERKNHQSFILKAAANEIENGKNLLKKYSEISLDNLNENNRFVLFLEPGVFDLGNSSLILNKSFVDIRGSSDKVKSVITSNLGVQNNGTITQLVDYINISNLIVKNTNTSFVSPWHTLSISIEDRRFFEERLDLLPSAYFQYFNPGQNFGKTVIEDVDFITLSESIQTMRIGAAYYGTYKNVSAGNFSFGYRGSANGNFINCNAGHFSFGSYGAETNGYFENCKAKYWSFGSKAALVKGNFVNCKADLNSFGVEALTNEGSYVNCESNEQQ
jgi:hypothetical protein